MAKKQQDEKLDLLFRGTSGKHAAIGEVFL